MKLPDWLPACPRGCLLALECQLKSKAPSEKQPKMSNGDDIVDDDVDDAAADAAAARTGSGPAAIVGSLCRPALHNFLTVLLLVSAPAARLCNAFGVPCAK